MKTKLHKILSPVLVFVMALSLVACQDNSSSSQQGNTGDTQATTVTDTLWATAVYTEDTVLETEGANTVSVIVTAGEKSVTIQAKTDKETFGEMLVETGIVTGEAGDYGLYITAVNGISAVYETDGAYWSFCDAEGNYMSYGVDSAQLTGADTFRLIYTPA